MEGRTFAVGLGAGDPGAGAGGGGGGGGGSGGSGSGGAVVWGGGSLRSLSLDKAALDWSGELFSAHVGVDAPFGESLRGGLAATWSEGEIKYTDRNEGRAGRGRSREPDDGGASVCGVVGSGRVACGGTLGYGRGRDRDHGRGGGGSFRVQKGDSEFLGAALGGSVPCCRRAG